MPSPYLALLAAECAADGPLCHLPPATRFEEARNLAWRIILTRRGWRGESPWPTLRDRLHGCRPPGPPPTLRSACQRRSTEEAAACLWCPDDLGLDGGTR